MLIEPVSGAPRYPLLTAADAVAVIDRAGDAGNVALLLRPLPPGGQRRRRRRRDRRAARGPDRARADRRRPGPREPGTGELDLDRYLDRLAATGYDGWVGLEYKPTGDSADAFDWLPRERRSAR